MNSQIDFPPAKANDVLDGSGSVLLDGVDHRVTKGSLVHIPPGVVHGARGRMRVLVVGVPDIADDDYFEA